MCFHECFNILFSTGTRDEQFLLTPMSEITEKNVWNGLMTMHLQFGT